MIATKENNLKEIFFRTCISSGLTEDLSIENADILFSARSSVSSTNSNNASATNDEVNRPSKVEIFVSSNDINSTRKSSMVNSTMAEDKSSVSELISQSYQEPVFRIHKFSEITS